MASSRRSRPADAAAVEAAADRAFAAFAGRRVAVALSAGRDSAALLVACARVAPRHAIALHAVHVHHGLSVHADAWVAACRQLATACGVPLDVRRVRVEDAARLGVEAAARVARYAALRGAAREGALDAIALAHHADDQAETLLLQLVRGAGPHGLAAMGAVQRDAGGLAWLRPLLATPRAAIEAYVAAHAIAYVDDDSNASPRHRRNALRQDVLPALARTFPAAPRALARAAAHQREAAALADDLAALDARDAIRDGTLDCAALGALPPHRARNLLRWFLRAHGVPAPSSARLAAMLAQLARPRVDARVHLAHAGVALGVHRGRIAVHAPPPQPFEVRWSGERDVVLPHGALSFEPATGEGLEAARIAGRAVTIAPRRGGERLAPHARRPRRLLAAWMQEAGMPAWERDALPLVFCDGALVAAPSLGVDVDWQARGAAPGWRLVWHPARARAELHG
ncbi:MAG: tRNA(Ile)-lysidine synthase [Betaproteobacteria bacterium]|nr:MAG: tRNA(Ile)-lysidine synthase [Betaproteobacteria bacterium]